jgi:transposase
LGLYEHFFAHRLGYAATFCDLRGHKVFDVVVGRSEAALGTYLLKQKGKDRVRVVRTDLASSSRALMKSTSPTRRSWPAASMWRFTCNNGITEGFHTKMELLSRQAYGFRNFQNYRLRVKVMCS